MRPKFVNLSGFHFSSVEFEACVFFSIDINVVTSLTSVAPSGYLVPGVTHQLTVEMTIDNQNEADANLEYAEVEYWGRDNFNITMRLVDADLSSDANSNFTLHPTGATLLSGDITSILNHTHNIEIRLLYDVSCLLLFKIDLTYAQVSKRPLPMC